MLYGIDIGKHQSTEIIDSAKDFVVIKATEGSGYVDSTCDTKYQYAKKKGKLLGVYHFARPDLNSATAEADFFVKNIKGYVKEAILVLDWETGNTKDVTWALTWLKRVYSLTGVRPLIYMSASVIRSADWSPVVKANFGLWVAGYPARFNITNPPTPKDGDMPYNISPWSFAAIWQYSSSAGTLDRDVASMTKDAWALYAGKTPKPVITTKDLATTTVIPFTSSTKEDPTLPEGQKVIVVKGVDGKRTIIYTITYTDGKQTQKVLKSDTTITPINEVMSIGTKVPPESPPEQPEAPETPDVPSQPETPATEPPMSSSWVNIFLKVIIALIAKIFKKG